MSLIYDKVVKWQDLALKANIYLINLIILLNVINLIGVINATIVINLFN